MYIYIVYSFCTTLPIAWQSICDLRSCKAMRLVRFLSLSCHFIFFYFFFFFCFVFFSLWHHLFQLEVRVGEGRGCPIQHLWWKELEHWIWLSSVSLFISAVCQCPLESRLLSENTGNISGTESGERRRNIPSMDMQHPVDNRWTDGLAHHPAGPSSRWQTMMMKRWDGSPLHVPERERERVGIDFSMMAHNWSTSWMPVVSPAPGEETGRQKRRRTEIKEVEIHLQYFNNTSAAGTVHFVLHLKV